MTFSSFLVFVLDANILNDIYSTSKEVDYLYIATMEIIVFCPNQSCQYFMFGGLFLFHFLALFDSQFPIRITKKYVNIRKVDEKMRQKMENKRSLPHWRGNIMSNFLTLTKCFLICFLSPFLLSFSSPLLLLLRFRGFFLSCTCECLWIFLSLFSFRPLFMANSKKNMLADQIREANDNGKISKK